MKNISAKIIASMALFVISFIVPVNYFSQEINWELTNGPKDTTGTFLSVYALGYTRDGNIFAGTNLAGVFKSTDEGNTWINCSSPDLINSIISYMVVDTNDVVYVASSDGMFKSSDEGNNWIKMTLGLPPTGFQSVAAGNDGLLFGGGPGIFRSLDYGSSWSFSGLDSCFVWVIKIFKDSIVVAGTFNYGPFISTDKGETWSSINNGLNQDQIIGLAISDTGNIFVGVTGGIYRSEDWGISWEQVLTTSPVWVGVIYLFKDQFIFGGSRGEGIFLSSDYGTNWDIINSGLVNLYINAFCGTTDGFIYAGSDNGVYKTYNPIVFTEINSYYFPSEYTLYQNYPNPFNPTTKIRWQSPVGSWQTLKVYDVLGREVATLVNEYKQAGKYEIEFGATNLPSGVYFYQLKAGSYVETKKMILLK